MREERAKRSDGHLGVINWVFLLVVFYGPVITFSLSVPWGWFLLIPWTAVGWWIYRGLLP
jgi:hypothetical protein